MASCGRPASTSPMPLKRWASIASAAPGTSWGIAIIPSASALLGVSALEMGHELPDLPVVFRVALGMADAVEERPPPMRRPAPCANTVDRASGRGTRGRRRPHARKRCPEERPSPGPGIAESTAPLPRRLAPTSSSTRSTNFCGETGDCSTSPKAYPLLSAFTCTGARGAAGFAGAETFVELSRLPGSPVQPPIATAAAAEKTASRDNSRGITFLRIASVPDCESGRSFDIGRAVDLAAAPRAAGKYSSFRWDRTASDGC